MKIWKIDEKDGKKQKLSKFYNKEKKNDKNKWKKNRNLVTNNFLTMKFERKSISLTFARPDHVTRVSSSVFHGSVPRRL